MKFKTSDKVEVRGERKTDGWLPGEIREQCTDPALSWVRIFYPDGHVGHGIRLTRTDIRAVRIKDAEAVKDE